MFSLWLRQRRRGVTSGATGAVERIEDAQSAVGRDGCQTGGRLWMWAACRLGDGDHPVVVFLGRSHPAWARSSHRPVGRARRHRRADPRLPASHPGNRTAACCLCTNMWITCAQRRRACAYAVEMLGIPLPGRNHDRAFTWESASRILCIQRKPELSTCQPAIDNK